MTELEQFVNAWVICWSEDQDTGFHDHDESGAAIAVISGSVREDRLRLGGEPRSRELGAGATFTVPPVLTRTGAYRIGADGELKRANLNLALQNERASTIYGSDSANRGRAGRNGRSRRSRGANGPWDHKSIPGSA